MLRRPCRRGAPPEDPVPAAPLPPLLRCTADPPTQATILLVGCAASLGVTRKIARVPLAQVAPQAALTCLFTAELWRLIVK